MAEYVAFARVDGGQVRPLVSRAASIEDVGGDTIAGVVVAARSSASWAPVELARELRAFWEVVCEEWAITTFFLFDPNSWRR